VLLVVGVVLSACNGPTTPQPKGAPLALGVSAVPIGPSSPPSPAAFPKASVRLRTALVWGETWPCMTFACPAHGASRASLYFDGHPVATMELDGNTLHSSFAFLVKKLPRQGAPFVVSIDSGAKTDVYLRPGDRRQITVEPVSRASIQITWFPCSPVPTSVPATGRNPVLVYREARKGATFWKSTRIHEVGSSWVPRGGGNARVWVTPGWYIVKMWPYDAWVDQVQALSTRIASVNFHTGC
jgi:hypothetical protein